MKNQWIVRLYYQAKEEALSYYESKLGACRGWANKLEKQDISFYYAMTLDAFGECFYEIHNVRRAS